MSGARNYLALVARFPEGTVHRPQITDGGAKVDLSGGEILAVAFGGSVEEAAETLADDPDLVVETGPEGEDKAQRALDVAVRLVQATSGFYARGASPTLLAQRFADLLAGTPEFGSDPEPREPAEPERVAIDRRLEDLKRLGQDVTGERLRKHGERIAELESSVRDLEVGRGPHQVAREEFGGLSIHVDQLARSLAAVEERLERLSFEKEAEGLEAHPPCGTFSAQALLAVEPESVVRQEPDPLKPWPEEWGGPPLQCMLVLRAGRELAGVVTLRDRRFRDAYVEGFARCRELDPKGRDTAAYKAEDLAGERVWALANAMPLTTGASHAFLKAARRAISAARAVEES